MLNFSQRDRTYIFMKAVDDLYWKEIAEKAPILPKLFHGLIEVLVSIRTDRFLKESIIHES